MLTSPMFRSESSRNTFVQLTYVQVWSLAYRGSANISNAATRSSVTPGSSNRYTAENIQMPESCRNADNAKSQVQNWIS